MKQPLTARVIALVICGTVCLALSATAAGPRILSPADGQIVRGDVVIEAEKQNIDGNSLGYISYQVEPKQDEDRKIEAPDPTYSAAVIHPFGYTWDTQKTYINEDDPWDPYNGSRKFPDGEYEITATAFGQSGEQVGERTTITVTLANRISDVPRFNDRGVLLRPGGSRDQTIRYKANGELYAKLRQDELERYRSGTMRGGGGQAGAGGGPGMMGGGMGGMGPGMAGPGMGGSGMGGPDMGGPGMMGGGVGGPAAGGAGAGAPQARPPRPPVVEMKMEAEWREVWRKPFGPGHTEDAKRWHGQRDEVVHRDPERGGAFPSWRDVAYAVVDEFPDSGWVEMIGPALPQFGEEWSERGRPYYLPDPTVTILNIPGAGGAGAAAGVGGMGAQMPGAQAGMGGPGMGAMGPGAIGMGGEAGMGAGPGAAGMPGGGGMGMAPGAGAAGMGAAGMGAGAGAAIRAMDRISGFHPVNLPGLHEKYRSTIQPDGSVEKMQIGDPRWPLAELWIEFPDRPVEEGDTWTSAITILPFFDQQYHLRVSPGGGTATGPDHLTDLRHYMRRRRVRDGVVEVEVEEGGRNGPITHTLDGFEYYKGYECARIVTRFRNYANPDAWNLNLMSGWRLADLNPRMLATGTNAFSAMVQTDLTRVTYFAYRSGHVVDTEDHYYHKMWLQDGGFAALLQRAGRYPGGAAAAGAAGGGAAMAGGQMGGGPGGQMPGMAGAMGQPGMGMGEGMMGPGMGGMPGAGGAAAATPTGGDEASMTHVVANMVLKITEQMGSDELHPRAEPPYAALPPVTPQPEPPGAKDRPIEGARRYVVVEDEATFYLPSSEKLEGKRGVVVDTTAKQLIELGYRADPAIDLSSGDR